MLPSLQDLPGFFPGIFNRGEGAAAAEQAGRGQGQRQHVDHQNVGRGHHGRDSLRLSPEAQAAENTAEDAEGSGDAVAETEGKSALGQAGGFLRKALEALRHDLGKALKAFGFDSAAVENFTKAFVEPVLDALKDGVNFTAELSFAAFSQVTTISGGNVSQSTSLVAQSLEIEVNRDTGEVSVSVAKLSFEQQIQATGVEGAGSAGGQVPLLVIDPDDLATPQELAQKILDGAAQPVETPDAEAGDAVETLPAEGEETAPAEGEETEVPAGELEQTLAEVRRQLAEDAVDLQTRLTIYAVSTYKNDKGESITKLLLDAQLKITSLENDATAQEEAESLNLVA
ncbi:hypothetical protein [Pelagibius marinus]|uniref:hypothetical protein n=1 Tax=Pelagibius marinus TaxID=2762760 RepID=UPI0018727512|nr:hypothetical protein [Pelagibius marinus]